MKVIHFMNESYLRITNNAPTTIKRKAFVYTTIASAKPHFCLSTTLNGSCTLCSILQKRKVRLQVSGPGHERNRNWESHPLAVSSPGSP